jgi:hypothetical protein
LATWPLTSWQPTLLPAFSINQVPTSRHPTSTAICSPSRLREWSGGDLRQGAAPRESPAPKVNVPDRTTNPRFSIILCPNGILRNSRRSSGTSGWRDWNSCPCIFVVHWRWRGCSCFDRATAAVPTPQADARDACRGQSCLEARSAPSNRVLSFAVTICGWTRPPRPQSVPAFTLSRPTALAFGLPNLKIYAPRRAAVAASIFRI